MNSGMVISRVPAWSLAVIAMLSIQLGSALSISLFPAVGPAGTAWLRLALGAVILLLLVRPSLRLINRSNLVGLIGLGASTGVMTSAFLSALERIPLGTTVAIEFLGPLAVAALSGRNVPRRAVAAGCPGRSGVVDQALDGQR